MKLNKYLLALSFFSVFSTNAAIIPKPISTDGRILSVEYDKNEVFEIPVKIGVATLIQLEDGETISESANSGAGLGDKKAWQVDIRGNNLFIKPIQENPDSNLVMVTNKRTYAFHLKESKRKASYIVRFEYPDTQAQLEKQAFKDSLAIQNKINGSSNPAKLKKINTHYFMRGDTKLAPSKMWDDGLFTYLQYANSKDLPAIYRILPDGKETLVNTHIESDTIVLQETAKDYMLRLGQSVLQIQNSLHDTDGNFNTLGTSNENTVRLELSGAQ